MCFWRIASRNRRITSLALRAIAMAITTITYKRHNYNDIIYNIVCIHKIHTKYILTRCVIFNFFKNYLFSLSVTILSPSKYSTSHIIPIMPRFFPILKTLLKHVSWYRQDLLFRFFFYLLNRIKKLSIHRCLQFCEEEKVSGEPSSVNTAVEAWLRFLVLAKSPPTSIKMLTGTLLCCKIHDWVFHNSVRFWRIALRNRRITLR